MIPFLHHDVKRITAAAMAFGRMGGRFCNLAEAQSRPFLLWAGIGKIFVPFAVDKAG